MAALKYSRQREAIKEFLLSRTDHPTADTVYRHMREIYPNISLGTVYRNLSLLSEIGEVQKINAGDGVDRFDGNLAPHYHVICTKCHRVTDLNMACADRLETEASCCYNGKILGHSTYFYGICSECINADEQEKMLLTKSSQ